MRQSPRVACRVSPTGDRWCRLFCLDPFPGHPCWESRALIGRARQTDALAAANWRRRPNLAPAALPDRSTCFITKPLSEVAHSAVLFWMRQHNQYGRLWLIFSVLATLLFSGDAFNKTGEWTKNINDRKIMRRKRRAFCFLGFFLCVGWTTDAFSDATFFVPYVIFGLMPQLIRFFRRRPRRPLV